MAADVSGNIIIMWILFASCITSTFGYYIEFHNCSQPQNIRTYNRQTLCNQPPVDKFEESQYILLKRQRTSKIIAHSCQVEVSKTDGSCGAYGHFKMSRPTSLPENVPVSMSDCARMLQSRSFFTKGMPRPRSLKLNKPEYFSSSPVGAMWWDRQEGIQRCEGKTHIANNITFYDAIRFETYRVQINEETLQVDSAGIVKSLSHHETLSCSSQNGSCITNTRTYLWEFNVDPCPWNMVRSIFARRINQQVISDSSRLIFNLTSPFLAPKCWTGTTFYTNDPELILVSTEDNLTLSEVSSLDLAPDYDLDARISYLEYYSKRELDDNVVSLQTVICHHRHQEDWSWELPVPLKNNHFMLTRGDSYLTFKCPMKKHKILTTDTCYYEVPLEDGTFVDPTTRIWKPFGNFLPCNERFPVIIQVVGGAWIRLPDLQHIDAPSSGYHGMFPPDEPTAFELSTIYTASELESLGQLIMFPLFRVHQLTASLFHICVRSGRCTGTPRYNQTISALEPHLKTDIIGWGERVLTGLSWLGDLASVLALLLFGSQHSRQILRTTYLRWINRKHPATQQEALSSDLDIPDRSSSPEPSQDKPKPEIRIRYPSLVEV